MSEGRGDKDRMLAGNEFSTCMVIDNDFAGAKSSLVKVLGLKGKMPVQEKEEARICSVIDCMHTFMYSGITLC